MRSIRGRLDANTLSKIESAIMARTGTVERRIKSAIGRMRRNCPELYTSGEE
jgi:hypothetical protein